MNFAEENQMFFTEQFHALALDICAAGVCFLRLIRQNHSGLVSVYHFNGGNDHEQTCKNCNGCSHSHFGMRRRIFHLVDPAG
jgi:hypothetical protein